MDSSWSAWGLGLLNGMFMCCVFLGSVALYWTQINCKGLTLAVVYELQLKLPWNIIADFIRFMCSEWVFGHSKIAHCLYSRSTNPKYFQVNIFTGYSAKVQLRFVCQVALPISIG